VTGWRGHVTEFGKGGHGASAAADRNKWTGAALAPGREIGDRVREGSLTIVGVVADVTGGVVVAARKTRARVQRAFGADGGLLPRDVRGERVVSYQEICRAHRQYGSA
jgi:hypothetical protein